MNAMPLDPSNWVIGDDTPPANVIAMNETAKEPPPLPESRHITESAIAEDTARQLIHAVCEYGREALHDLPVDWFPTPALRKMASKCLDAADSGMTGWQDIMLVHFPADAERFAFMECVEQGILPASPAACQALSERLRALHVAQQTRTLGSKIAQAVEAGDDPGRFIEQLAKLREEAASNTGLLAMAYAMRFDPQAKPPADECTMALGDAPITARGNLTVVQGKSKVGKSAVVSSLLGAALRGQKMFEKFDTLGIEWTPQQEAEVILHFDTEQSPHDFYILVARAYRRSATPKSLDRLLSVPLVRFSRKDRLAIVEQMIAKEHEKHGRVDLVVIDGVADLCASPNDEEEALALVAHLMALCHKFNTSIVCILHENPGTDQGKTRGHLGSELNRKAFANLRIDKDEEGISTLWGTDMRKKDIPKSQGTCFQYSDEEQMHVTVGKAGAIMAERNAEKSQRLKSARDEKDLEKLDRIYEAGEPLDYTSLVDAICEEFAIKDRGAKVRVAKWRADSVIEKLDDGRYALKK